MDIHYKLIPVHAPCQVIHSFDRRLHDPLHAWKRHQDPYRLSYLVHHPPLFDVHVTDHLDTAALPLDCQRVKLARSYVDAVRNDTSHTFEEELYHFVTLLNFDVPTLAPLLGLDVMTCTRLLPQCLRLWVYHYEERSLPHVPVDSKLAACFGPPDDDLIPVRVLRGQLAPCTSDTTLLSLNNDLEARLSGAPPPPYLWHYSLRHKTLVPLAYNPLENPLMVL